MTVPASFPTPVSVDPVLPDYGSACIANLVGALVGRRASDADGHAWLPALTSDAEQIVLLVLDGLGWEQLRARPGLAPTLQSAQGIERPITSVAPTTTATALTSLTTGRRPSEHGIFGYRVAVDGDVLNVLRWTLGSWRPRDARRIVPAADFQHFPPFEGNPGPTPVVSKDEFGGTGFTAAHLGDSPLHGYKVLSSLPVTVASLLEQGEPFVYAYYDGIDRVAHANGLGELYDAELRAVDRLVADLAGVLPPGAVLVVTADHGQIDIGPNVELLGRELMAGTSFLSGEGRFRWLHAVEGAEADLIECAAETYAATTWVKARDELVDDGWLGGPPADRLLARLGDVALIPHAPIAFLDPADTGESRLAARHGSLTVDEMLVPLVALGRSSP